MALTRVYCGLASADATNQPATAGPWLTVAVVDDSGRLLDVCDITDDAMGYAYLSSLLGERSSGGYTNVAVATDSDENSVPMLFMAAGRAIAFVDDDSADDFAERFADDSSTDEIRSGPNERRAVGLARALQAGALSAVAEAAPKELANLKPVLSAHAAVLTGRHNAAIALREVLRELNPAALRAYPDPAEPLPLAVLDALPEPGLLGPASRGRDAAVAAELVTAGFDEAAVNDAITALRVAITETPRRAGISKALTAATAHAVRQAVLAVRASDSAGNALVALLSERLAQPARGNARSPRGRVGTPSVTPLRPVRDSDAQSKPQRRRTTPLSPVASHDPHDSGYGGPTPVSPAPVYGYPPQPAYATAPPAYPGYPPAAAQGGSPYPADYPAEYPASGYPPAGYSSGGYPTVPAGGGAFTSPSGSYPTVQGGGPAFTEPSGSYPAIPAPRPASDSVPPGSRMSWPVNGSADDMARVGQGYGHEPTNGYDSHASSEGGRVTPPWQALDLPPQPPMMRLIESATGFETETVPVMPRDVMDDHAYDSMSLTPSSLDVDSRELGIPAGPVRDGDLLIFNSTRSAWFTGPDGFASDPDLSWENPFDVGWQVAEQATSRPTIGDETGAGLPRRVPHANLVPGAPLPPQERPLRIVRDPASIAAHTSGYFGGWRRAQNANGYPVGGRPGRESAVGWDFSRDHGAADYGMQDYDERDYGYRSAGSRL